MAELKQQIEQHLRDNDIDRSQIQSSIETFFKRSCKIDDLTKQYLEHEVRKMKQREQKLDFEQELLRREKHDFEDTRHKVIQTVLYQAPHLVQLDVGGQEFETSSNTLLRSADLPPDEHNIIAATLGEIIKADHLRNKIRIDRDPQFFSRILDYLRHRVDGTEVAGLVWLEDPRVTDVDLKMVRVEAHYYKVRSLSNYITWELVRRGPKVVDLAKCGFAPVTKLSGGRTQLSGYKTHEQKEVVEKNFEGISIESVTFAHQVHFKGCLLRGAKFTNCYFLVGQLFTDCDHSGVKFINCKSNGLPPKGTFFTERCIGRLPTDWS